MENKQLFHYLDPSICNTCYQHKNMSMLRYWIEKAGRAAITDEELLAYLESKPSYKLFTFITEPNCEIPRHEAIIAIIHYYMQGDATFGVYNRLLVRFVSSPSCRIADDEIEAILAVLREKSMTTEPIYWQREDSILEENDSLHISVWAIA